MESQNSKDTKDAEQGSEVALSKDDILRRMDDDRERVS